MASLTADRFLCERNVATLDLATGRLVQLCTEEAGTRAEQQAWVEASARAHSDGRLLDFGFLGEDRRFEVRPSGGCRVPAAVASAAVLDWLEHDDASSTGVLHVPAIPDAREMRLRGFVPVNGALLSDKLVSTLCPWIEGRSIVVLTRPTAGLALVLLRLRRANVREIRVLIERPGPVVRLVGRAAERRAAYESTTPEIGDSRGSRMLVDSQRLIDAGRHAAAERTLRAAIAALDRRGEVARAGEAGMRLGRLLLDRGRAQEAIGVLEDAHSRFQRAHVPLHAIRATVEVGMAQVELARPADAERSCRVAYAAAATEANLDTATLAATALVRVLLWQERFTDAREILESTSPCGDPELIARYWCLAARLNLVDRRLTDARRALERARPSASACTPAIESLVRRWEAVVQAHVGDVEALQVHVAAGLAAARAARLPLRAVKLRLVLIEGFVDADRRGPARRLAAHLGRLAPSTLPPVLRERVNALLKRIHSGEIQVASRPREACARETMVRFHSAATTGAGGELDGLSDLLSLSHQVEDEVEALTRAVVSIRKQTHAVGAAISGRMKDGIHLLASTGGSSHAVARRCVDAGFTIGPEPSGGWVETAVPIRYLGRVIGALTLRWTGEGLERSQRAMAFVSAAAAACAALTYVLVERHAVPDHAGAPLDLVGGSPAIEEVRRAVGRAANAPFTVLIEGESGSGKELVARAVHRAGNRRDRPFSALNCAAMPEDLVDVELFGHAKGAFTGASGERLGLFEGADGGTVFLDEVGELSTRAQAKVLRVLQEGEIRRIGENVTRSFDARLVAATNRPLRGEVEAGRFRQDLLYRLDVIRIVVPPLRERVEDIPLLAAHLWQQSALRMGSKAVLGQGVLSALARYDWPGNVRELQNVLSALVVAVPRRGVVGASQLPPAVARATHSASHESLECARTAFERRFVRAALARAAGHRGQTASALGLSRQGLSKLMQRLHLDA